MQTQILALLHQADALAPSFRASHDNAARLAASVNASSMQITNLEQLISRNPQPNSIRDRTLVKLQQAIEESLCEQSAERSNKAHCMQTGYGKNWSRWKRALNSSRDCSFRSSESFDAKARGS